MKEKLTEVKHPRGVSLAHMIRQGHIFAVSSFTLDKLEDANASVTISVITFARSIKSCYSESRVALYDFRDEPKYLDQTQVPRIDFSRVVFINACCRSLHVRYLNADNYFETLALTLSLAFQTLLSSLHKRESKHSDANNQSIGFCHNCKIYSR